MVKFSLKFINGDKMLMLFTHLFCLWNPCSIYGTGSDNRNRKRWAWETSWYLELGMCRYRNGDWSGMFCSRFQNVADIKIQNAFIWEFQKHWCTFKIGLNFKVKSGIFFIKSVCSFLWKPHVGCWLYMLYLCLYYTAFFNLHNFERYFLGVV